MPIALDRRYLTVLTGTSLLLVACTAAPDAPATPNAITPSPAAATVAAPSPTSTAVAVTPSPAVAVTPSPAAPTPAAATATPASVASAPPTDRPAAPDTGEGRVVNEDHGYAVTLPEGWRAVAVDDDLTGDLTDALAGDPHFADFMETFGDQLDSLYAQGLSLFAFRTADLETDFATNVNVLSLPTYGLTLDQLEELNVAQLEQLDAVRSRVETERVELPAGEALYMTYRILTTAADGSTVEARIHQYLIVAGATQHIMTITGEEDAELTLEAQAMAESFELLGR